MQLVLSSWFSSCGVCMFAAGSLGAAGQQLGIRAASGALGGISSAGSAAGGAVAESATAAVRQQRRGAGGSILWHSGNMYGMQVRFVGTINSNPVAGIASRAATSVRRFARLASLHAMRSRQ